MVWLDLFLRTLLAGKAYETWFSFMKSLTRDSFGYKRSEANNLQFTVTVLLSYSTSYFMRLKKKKETT